MKFELEPYNRGLSNDELLNDLRLVARQLKRNFVTQDDYNKKGRLCAATFKKRFGSWGKAHELAGLKRTRNYQATEKDCIADMKRVAALLKTDSITNADYIAHGNFSLPLISRRVGPWEAAIAKAGLKLSSQYNKTISEEELFKNLEQLWEKLGRQPKRADFVKPLSLCCYGVYPKRFGTYRKALEAFIVSLENQQDELIENHPNDSLSETNEPIKTHLHKTSRTISWRLRFLVMRRDDFKCCIDGKSPATHPGTILQVDHIHPWSKGGETVMENLQTLCEQCNIGKSNLSLQKDN